MKQNEQYLLGEIKGELTGIREQLTKMNGTLIAHDKKINLLETFRDNWQGRLSIIGGIAGMIGAMITLLINYFTKN